MRIVNGIEMDDGVDESDAYDWRDQYSTYHEYLYMEQPPKMEWDGGKWAASPNNRPQDGRVCDCEDAPCCGHYEP